jgi:hypothetical protein
MILTFTCHCARAITILKQNKHAREETSHNKSPATQKSSTFNFKTCFTEHNMIYKIEGSSDSDYEDFCLEKCDDMWSGGLLPTLHRMEDLRFSQQWL